MKNRCIIRFYWLILLAAILLLALPIQAKQNVTKQKLDIISEDMGKYISSINYWDGDKLWITMYRLSSYVQNSHPEIIEWLEKNADKNANFLYVLALLEDENNRDVNRNIFNYNSRCEEYNDKTVNFLHSAAQKEHASALNSLANIAFCEGDLDKSFEYYRRAFYAGSYRVLRNEKLFHTFQESHPQQIEEMEHFAKNVTKGDFNQFYELMGFYYYNRLDKQTAQKFYKLAEKNAQAADKYRLVSFYRKYLGVQVDCNEKEIDTYHQSILAGNMHALELFTWHCKIEDSTQEILTEGLQYIEQKVNARIISWQAGNTVDSSTLFNHIGDVRRLAEFYSKRYSQNKPSLENLEKADYYYQHLIKLGNTSIFDDLGNMWLRNASPIYEKHDATVGYFKAYCQKAHSYFYQGSQHNHPHSIKQLTIFYLDNKCAAKDEAQSIHYQEKLSLLADVSINATAELLSLIYKLYEIGYFSQAKKYAQQLADYGEINAMQLLAQLWLIDQDNLEIDEEKAQFWYEKTFAIMQNYPLILGRQYLQASKDFRKAGFNETADTYLQRAIEIIGDEEVQQILQKEPVE